MPESALTRTARTAKGNVSPAIKSGIAKWFASATDNRIFGHDVAARLECQELSVYEKPQEPGKKEAKVVFELDVTQDMTNFKGTLHGGCIAYLVDLCSSVALSLLAADVGSNDKVINVSLALNTTFHAPALIGSRVEIVNTSVALGARVMTARTEIYDKTHGRLVATGIHMKMPPSTPKL